MNGDNVNPQRILDQRLAQIYQRLAYNVLSEVQRKELQDEANRLTVQMEAPPSPPIQHSATARLPTPIIQAARAMTAMPLPRGERDDRDLALTQEAIAHHYERADVPLDSGQRASHPITAERLDDYWQRRQAWQNRHWPDGAVQYDAERAALMERVAFRDGYNPNL